MMEVDPLSSDDSGILELYGDAPGIYHRLIHKACRSFDEPNLSEKLRVNPEYGKPVEVVPSSESELLQSIVEKLDVIIEYLTKKSSESLIIEDK